MDPKQLNISTIVRDFAVALKTDQLPAGDTVIQMTVTGEGDPVKKFILLRDNKMQMCDENPGTDVDVYLTADLETFGKIWYGKLDIVRACDSGLLKVVGATFYTNNVSKWLGISQFA